MTLRNLSIWFRTSILMFFVAVVFPVSSPYQSPAQKKLQVVILAVSHFDDHGWDNAQLQLGIEKSAKDLEDFSRRKFPSAEIHVLSSRDKTTHDSIESFLRGDFHRFANGTVTLFFVLSHGVPSKSQNPNFDHDLLIVTSDTDKKDVRPKALSVAKDLVPEFAGLEGPGSVVVAFLDTCYSGAASSLNMRILKDVAENYGLRMMIMASSLSETQSYRATFSEALLALWNAPSSGTQCVTPELAPEILRRSIQHLLEPQQLGATEGLPRVVVHYDGLLCLESFAADSGLIVFFNGAPAPPVAAIIKANGQPLGEPVPLEVNDVIPYKIARNKYTVDIVQDDGTLFLPEHDVDLLSDPVAFETVGAPKTAQLGSMYLRTADYVRFAGLPNEHVQAYQKRAFASFVAQDDYKSATRVASTLKSHTAVVDEAWAKASALTLENKNQPKPKAEGWSFEQGGVYVETEQERRLESEIGAAALARLEKLAGDFERAAYFYQKALGGPFTNGAQSRKLALQAYFAYGASDQPEDAQRVRKSFELPLERICPQCVEKEQSAIHEASPNAYEQFESLCIVRALSHLDY